MRDLVIYHRDCFDGITAAWVVDRYYSLRNLEKPEFIGAKYGEPPPDCIGRTVYIVDFSYPRDILQKMALESKSILVLDHHKTAEADLQGLSYTVFDMNKSGAGLAWDWFFAGTPRHWLVDVVEDRDIWRFKFPDTKDIHGYLGSLDMDLPTWWGASRLPREYVAEKGAGVLGYIASYGRKAAVHQFVTLLGDETFPTMNIAYQNCSDHLDALIKEGKTDRAASFYYSGQSKLFHFSLRSRGDFDVSAVAKVYGGGGHKNAAGFTLTPVQFSRVIMDSLED